MNKERDFDIIVIGAGHAGCEAAIATARLGLSTCLFTINIDTIAQLSCNPAIGGQAKGHMVREIDALGGEMAKVADAAGIQFRLLNRSKGPAVWSLRAQADRSLYRAYMKKKLEESKNLYIKQGTIERLIVVKETGKIDGVETSLGIKYGAGAVIVTTGTFLKGLIHIGMNSFPAGRAGEFPSTGLSDSLSSLGFKMGRLKTGTPPRLDSKSINFDKIVPQWGDTHPAPFSHSTREITNPQLPCYITYTNDSTHEVIKRGLERSPLYSGRIKGTGPRYCPSIEDKVVRFFERPRHQVFLEPEGLDTKEYYANGISTSLPYDIQVRVVRSIEGLEEAEIMRPGYAIEYDFVHPTQLRHTLETKSIEGLYLAGQINGTSGYEEAAAQGLMAGVNAALKLKNRSPLILRRDEAYIGVLIDDLVTKGVDEPFRMFTSRAEFRLLLRNDNAETRLTERGYEAGLVNEEAFEEFRVRASLLEMEKRRLKKKFITPNDVNQELIERNTSPISENASLEQLLKRPELDYKFIKAVAPPDKELPPSVCRQIETEVKYDGYIRQQMQLIEKVKRLEEKHIPDNFDYREINGLSKEILGRLEEVRPSSIAQANRIPGMTPAAVSLIMVYLEKMKRGKGDKLTVPISKKMQE